MSKFFGKRLKEKRQECGLFQTDLAEELKVTRGTISQYECGAIDPSIDNLIKLCEILNVDPNYLIGYSAENQKVNLQKVARSGIDFETQSTQKEAGKIKKDLADHADKPDNKTSF